MSILSRRLSFPFCILFAVLIAGPVRSQSTIGKTEIGKTEIGKTTIGPSSGWIFPNGTSDEAMLAKNAKSYGSRIKDRDLMYRRDRCGQRASHYGLQGLEHQKFVTSCMFPW